MKSNKKSQEFKFIVPWGHVALKTWGDHKNEPVFMIHGTLDNVGSYSRLVELLPDNYYYVAIDLPGHGLSSHFVSGTVLDFHNYILTIKYALEQLRWNKCVCIGHSFGAQLGVMFSIIFPGIFTKLVALDGFIPKIVDNYNLISRIREVNQQVMSDMYNKSFRLYTKDQVLDALQNRRQFSLNEKAALEIFDRSVTKVGNLYKYNRDLRARGFIYPNMNFDQYKVLLKHLSTPILIILPNESWFQLFEDDKSYWESYKKLFPKTCKFAEVEGNHDVHNNNPERVAPLISSFLGEITSKL